MVFRRSNNALRPINSRKNIFQDVSIIAAATLGSFRLLQSVDAATLADTDAVTFGAKVNTMYIECWIYGNAVAGVNSPITWSLQKSPGDVVPIVTPELAGSNDDKRWVYAMGKGLIGASGNGQPGYLIRGWFSIPKRMRRIGANDSFFLSIKNDTANDLNVCIMCIYKWYF